MKVEKSWAKRKDRGYLLFLDVSRIAMRDPALYVMEDLIETLKPCPRVKSDSRPRSRSVAQSLQTNKHQSSDVEELSEYIIHNIMTFRIGRLRKEQRLNQKPDVIRGI